MKAIYYSNAVSTKKNNTRVTVAKADIEGGEDGYAYIYFTRLADAALEGDFADDENTCYHWNRAKTRGVRCHRVLISTERIEPLMTALFMFENKFLK